MAAISRNPPFYQELRLAAVRAYLYVLDMLTEWYIEALLVDEKAADEIWELWNLGMISDQIAVRAWYIVASTTDG